MRKTIEGRVSDKDDHIRLEDFLKNRLHLTKKEISRAKFRESGIRVNGERRRIDALLKAGDLVEILLEAGDKISENLTASGEELSVLYEDGDVIVLDKPAGISVHPAGRKETDTLANRLAFYLREKKEDSVIRIFGRLDRDTSGVVLAVKNRAAAARLERQRKSGALFKHYLAITGQAPSPLCGTIDIPLGIDPRRRNRMCVSPDGKTALTDYETLAVYDSCALIHLSLRTGRTHQIRMHMAAVGCPLLGDPLYGNGAAAHTLSNIPHPLSDHPAGENDSLPGIKRTALHAYSIHFLQPFTGKELLVQAPVPEDMLRFIFAQDAPQPPHKAAALSALPPMHPHNFRSESLPT